MLFVVVCHERADAKPFVLGGFIRPILSGIAIEFVVADAARDLLNGTKQTREELSDYVGNDHRHFVSLMAFGVGGRTDLRRNFAHAFACSCRGVCYTPFDRTSGGLGRSKKAHLFDSIDLVKKV